MIKKVQPRKKEVLPTNKDIIKLKDELGNPKKFFSASKVGLFLTCPLKYKFKYVDKIKTPINAPSLTMGTAVHKCMEYIYESKAFNQKVDVKIIDNIVDSEMDREYCPLLDDVEWEELKEYTKKLVKFYNSKKRKHKPMVIDDKYVCTEFDFQIPFNHPVTGENPKNIHLRGSIDLITEDYKIIDFKTAKRAYPIAKVDTSVQMTVYSYAFRELFGVEEEQLMFDVLIKKEKTKRNPTGEPELKNFRTKRTVNDYIQLYNIIDVILKSEEHGVFYPAFPAEGGWCNFCDFKSPYCEKWNGK